MQSQTVLKGKILAETVSVNGAISSEANTLEGNIVTTQGHPYSGAYVVTPTQSTQTLNTAGAYLQYDVTINPIPSNYGLITWDGSEMMVS